MGTAQAQAEYMASSGRIEHTGPGGLTVTERLLAAGYPLAGDLSLGGFRSENIIGVPGMTPQEAVNAWTGDDIHLHTMLSPDLQEIGAGVAEKDGTIYYVIDCARPTTSGAPQAYTPGAESAYSAGLNEVIVPVAISTPDAKGEIIHEVKSGQSLWQIAIAYGVKIDEIRRLNQLPTAYLINPGDTLLIKNVGTPTQAPPTEPATPTASSESTLISRTPEGMTPTASVTPTPTVGPAPASLTSAGGAVGAIILVALVAAGLVAWAGRARPA
jgi:LysM repeat protein